MKIQNEGFLELLQMADSALPTGGYAFSNGLESAASLGLIRNAKDLKKYLIGYLQQVYASETPFMVSSFNLEPPFEEQQELLAIVELLDAFIIIPKMHHASLVQGKNYLRIFTALFPDLGFGKLRAWFAKNEVNPHFVIVFGLCMKSIGYSFKITQKIYYYITLRDQISAAIRLGLLGPIEGAAMQKNLLKLEDGAIVFSSKDYKHAVKRAPLIDLFQGIHENLYSRIFQT